MNLVADEFSSYDVPECECINNIIVQDMCSDILPVTVSGMLDSSVTSFWYPKPYPVLLTLYLLQHSKQLQQEQIMFLILMLHIYLLHLSLRKLYV